MSQTLGQTLDSLSEMALLAPQKIDSFHQQAIQIQTELGVSRQAFRKSKIK
jgi:hypothetical protein